MLLHIIIFFGLQVGLALIVNIVALPAFYGLRRALQEEIRLLPTRSNPQEAARFFSARRTRQILRLNRALLLTLIVVMAAAILPTLVPNILNPFTAPDAALTSLQIIIIAFYASLIGYIYGIDLLNTRIFVTIYAEAGRAFEVSSLGREEITAQRRRRFLFLIAPSLLCFEVAGLLYILLGNQPLTPVFILLLTFLPIAVLYIFFSRQRLRLNLFLTPIEQTEWAPLQERIQAWARLAGTQFRSIEIWRELIGMSNALVVGRSRPTLILSEHLLRNTEWRQQDALTAMMLGTFRRRRTSFLLLRILLIVLLVAFVAGLIVLVELPTTEPGQIMLIWLVVVSLILLALIVQLSIRRINKRRQFSIDDFAANLTGDPIAIMVALHTICALNGIPLNYKGSRQPAVARRLAYLDQLARADGPRAPQAGLLVPSSVPARFGPYTLSAPFNEATPPEPVPAAPYGTLL
ncbi:MAG: hypothetical protein J2P37_09150 [Ktedonobacteraceae bacterium]|nr:hypothetical protein [Ktedonobacteraceae bacterium]